MRYVKKYNNYKVCHGLCNDDVKKIMIFSNYCFKVNKLCKKLKQAQSVTEL